MVKLKRIGRALANALWRGENDMAMMTEPDDLLAYLETLGIAYEAVWHEPIFTVEDGRALKASLAGAHSKNLLLKDKAGALVLVSAEAEAQLRLNRLHKALGTKRLSFASEAVLLETLGVKPGSVTGFALVNDAAARVRFVMERTLAEAAEVNFHPLKNTGTIRVSQTDFRKFVAATGHEVDVVDFALLAEG
jgi:Ala-tRNA(Pro) deacylase